MTETAHSSEKLAIGPMEPSELPVVVDLLARALLNNPSSIGMFGSSTRHRLRSLRTSYGVLLSEMLQPPLVARVDGRIAAAIAVSPPGACFYERSKARARRVRVSGLDIHVESPSVPWRFLPGLLLMGPAALQRVTAMARFGAEHDPASPHWHVELVGVEPGMQGRGIGGRLLEAALRQADMAGEPSYLETDTPENVAFYQRRGFSVTGQDEPLGVRTWYMERPAHPRS